MFDISLMVCLLRNFTDLDIQDSLPIENNLTTAADISRIKFYRNCIVHSDSGKVTETKFSEIKKCVVEMNRTSRCSVTAPALAIRRQVPDLEADIDALMISPLTNVSDILYVIRLEKEMEKTNHRLSTVSQKLETLEKENNNIKEIHKRTLKEWKDTDTKFISTSATTFILQSLKHNRGVIITGSPGCGKSVTAHHIALQLKKEGYEIILCDDPAEILKHFTTEKIQIFVIDDICGKFALNQHKSDSWEQNDGKLNMLFESCNQNDDNEHSSNKFEPKFIITCRENIYGHKTFPKLTCFSPVQCSFSTEYKNSPDEMRNIALSYLPENIVNDIENICLYDFFPLLCALYCKKAKPDPNFFSHPVEIIEQEISEMKIKSEASFLCLSLLVLKNNKCCKHELISSSMKQLINAVCRDSEIESLVSIVSIQKCFERLEGIYITETDTMYTTIHDKMFDIIAAAIAPSIINCLIEFVDIAFLAHRIHLSSCSKSSLPFVIYISPELEGSYLNRQYNEAIKGKNWEVFGSIQTENKTYRLLLLSFLKDQDTGQDISYVPDKDGATPLFVSSYLRYIDFVDYFRVKNPGHIDMKDKEGRSSFYVACENGHISVVKYLMKCQHDINEENAEKTTVLSATCLNGHADVVQLMLDNNAETNKTNKLNQSTLFFACLNNYGNVKLVERLLNDKYNVDITIKDTFQNTALHLACEKGHTDTVKTLIEFGMDVNQKQKNGWTPLFVACRHGCYDTVKYIIDFIHLKRENKPVVYELKKLHSSKKQWTVLHTSCFHGHTEVVKLLIDIGMNVNDTTTKGLTPFYLACAQGRNDTVKYLLDLKDLSLNSCVDTTKVYNGWTVLHVACFRGHKEVVKLLIDAGMNVNFKLIDGSTPLYKACQNGHYETVKLLLDMNGQTLNSCVDTTLINDDGCSVLHAACWNGHTQVVKLLKDVGMNANDPSFNRSTPLYIPCHYETVKLLLDLNSLTLKALKVENGCSILHAACDYGRTELVKVLIDAGMNVNDTTSNGSTPLYLAYMEGHYDTVKLLLNLNGQTTNSCIDITVKDKDGLSVLHAACAGGNPEIVKLLIDIGMNRNETSNDGSTPLYIACQHGRFATVKLLLDFNGQVKNSSVDTTIKDEDGWSVLHAACHSGHKEVVKLLIDVGMNVNDTSTDGFSPLLLACQNGHDETVKYLLDLNGQALNSCVDTTINDEDEWSGLHVACTNGYTEVVKLLIDYGMNVNDTTNDGCTPLHLACQNGHYDTVTFLLDLNGQVINSHVDLTIKDEDGNSALNAASSAGHSKIEKLLIDFGTHANDR